MIFESYLDGSSDEPSGGNLFAVGGFVGNAETWLNFEPKWVDALPVGVKFHATDCFGGRGQFAGMNISERSALLDCLTDLIIQTDIRVICCGIDIANYKKLAPKKRRNEFLGNLYVACFSKAIELACSSWGVIDPENPSTGDGLCAFIVESDEYSDSAQKAFNQAQNDDALWYKGRLLTFAEITKENAPPALGAADLGAFLGTKEIAQSPDGRIPWTRYFDKLKAENKIFRLVDIDSQSLNILDEVFKSLTCGID